MTSKQVMLTALMLLIGGCGYPGVEPLQSPYPTRHVWAVAPLRNESGSGEPDGLAMADHLVRQFENASNLDVLPVNRTIKAMEKLGLAQVSNPDQAYALLEVLGVDGLLVGTITAYDPYDPPKLGMALELYANTDVEQADADTNWRLSGRGVKPGSGPSLAGLQRLSWSPTDARPSPQIQTLQPVSIVSAILDSSDPDVKMGLQRYAYDRGLVKDEESWHLYRISMDLYSEFVSYVMSWRLLHAEGQRLEPAMSNPNP